MKNKKILLIKFGAMGDIIHSTIIPQSIKAKHPDCEIHYLTLKRYVGLLKHCPYVDRILTLDDSIFDTIKVLFKESYDNIVCLNHTIKMWFLAKMSFTKKILFRATEGESWVDNYFYTGKQIYDDLEQPEYLCLSNNADLNKSVSERLSKYPKPHIFINPGGDSNGAREGRIWSLEKWRELANNLLKKYGGTVFVTGSPNEKKYHLPIESENIIVLSGTYSMDELCEGLSLADLLISGDSGPIHVASGYNVKTIAILGSTSPDLIKPYGPNGHYLAPKTECKYCWERKCKYLNPGELYAPCIESIQVSDVINKIEQEHLLETVNY